MGSADQMSPCPVKRLTLLLLVLALEPSVQDCLLENQFIRDYNSTRGTGTFALTSFRDLRTSGCTEECKEALAPDKYAGSCEAELLTCRTNSSFVQDFCQPFVSCNLRPSDPRWAPPLHDTDPSWLKQSYTLGCSCNAGHYGLSCEHVRPGMCEPMTKDTNGKVAGQVWDGTYVASAWTPNDEGPPADAKEAVCFLKGAADQTGIASTIVSGIRHHRVNLTLGQMDNSTGTCNITWSIISRFRPNNNNIGEPGDPQKQPWAKYCLPCDLAPANDAPDTACNTKNHSKLNAGKITCLGGNKSSPGWQQCSVPDRPYIFPTNYAFDQKTGGECCENAREWFRCELSGCAPECTAEGGLGYQCAATACTAEQPDYLNPAKADSNWNLIKSLPTLISGASSVHFDGINYLKGTVANSTIKLPNSQSPDFGFDFSQTCMRGSCANAAQLPYKSAMVHIGTASPLLSADPYCSNHTAPPVPTDDDGSSKSLSLMATITALCSLLTVLVFVFLLIEHYQARALCKWFLSKLDEKRLTQCLEIEAPDRVSTQLLEDDEPIPMHQSVVGVTFDRVGYSVPGRQIVQSVTGVVHPGEMVGLLGPSGAGKSSLLDILAGRVKVGEVSGHVKLFSQNEIHSPFSPEATSEELTLYSAAIEDSTVRRFRANMAYVLQDDVLVPTDTVAETLLFACRLKDKTKNEEQCKERVHQVLQSLKLDHIANSKIGNGVVGGGISGGERKRVSIGVELVSTPSCLVLDEPTSGLDSSSTLIVLNVLRKVADSGCAVIFSIHQPSLKAFLKFDQILLLSNRGQQLFYGSPQFAVQFFRELANNDQNIFPDELQQQLLGAGTPLGLAGAGFENPAEFLLDAASCPTAAGVAAISDAFFRSKEHQHIEGQIENTQKKSATLIGSVKPLDSAAPCKAFWLLFKRSMRNIMRDPSLLLSHLLVTGVIAGCMAIFARNLPLDFVGVQTRVFLFNFLVLYLSMVATSSMGSLIQERSVFVREKTAHFYPAWCYCGTKLIADLIPLRALPTFVLAYILYWPIGLRDSDEAFAKFLLALLLANFTAATSSLFFSALCKDVGQANLYAAAYIIYSFIFSGMLLTAGGAESLAIRYTSIFFFPWEAMCGAEFADSDDPTKQRKFLFNPKIGGNYVIPGPNNGLLEPTQAILDNFNLEDRFTFDVMLLVCYIVMFMCATLALMTFNKFAK